MIFNVTGGGGGGTGATLTVEAPAGCTVTISKNGKTKNKTAGADGLAVFKGLSTGDWTVTISDGGQTASKVVTVTADYATSITFFAATIHITYPVGSTCTATDGVTILTAPDTSGTWACVVPNAGAWTVSISNNAGTKSKSVTITSNGQTADCVLGAPSDYQEVVYLQSTGTQYINTNLTGKTYRFRVSTKVNIAESGGRLYGDDVRPYNMLLWPVTDGIYPMATYDGSPLGDKLPLGKTYIIDRACSSSGVVTVKNDSNTIVTYDAKSLGFDNTKNYSPAIFCYNSEGTFKTFCKAKLYWMTIYDIDGTTPLREFVPCYRKADSVAGLYDLVNDVFYTNAGTGTFVVGGDV